MSGTPALAVRGVRSVVTDMTREAAHDDADPVRAVSVLVVAMVTEPTSEHADALAHLRGTAASTLVVCGAAEDDRPALGSWLAAGADAVLPFSCDERSLRAAVESLAHGHPALAPDLRSQLLDTGSRRTVARDITAARLGRLSPREERVLRGLVAGRTARQMADEDVLSASTIRSQLRAVLRKLDVPSALAAVALARQAGWSPSEADRDRVATSRDSTATSTDTAPTERSPRDRTLEH